MAWYKWGGIVLKRSGKVAIAENCCCFSCCPDDIVIPDGFGNGTLLTAEIIAATNNCATVGATADFNITSPGFWRLDDCLDPACDYGPIVLACGGDPENPRFTLSIGGFPLCGCPSPGVPAVADSTVCDPFELIFTLEISTADTDPTSGPCWHTGLGCCTVANGGGTVTIRITKT